MNEALEQAKANVLHAERYLAEKTQAREDAEYRERIAKTMLDDAREALAKATAATLRAEA